MTAMTAAVTSAFLRAMLAHSTAVQVAVLRRVGTDDVKMLVKPPTSDFSVLSKATPWLRHENAQKAANVFVRPVGDHPWLFFDDVKPVKALALARKYAALVVETSIGNCQAWLLCTQAMTVQQRHQQQRELGRMLGSDPASTAGDKWGRLPGFTNQKPEKKGQWTNLQADTTATGTRYAPLLFPQGGARGLHSPPPVSRGKGRQQDGVDHSVREFSYACNALRRGEPPERIEAAISQHVAATGRRKGRDYPARTLAAAQRVVAR